MFIKETLVLVFPILRFLSEGLSVPLIVVMKRGDQLDPLRSVKLEESVDDLVQSILLATLPILV